MERASGSLGATPSLVQPSIYCTYLGAKGDFCD